MAGKKTDKVSKVMREFKADDLHSGSKKGPKVTNRRQAIAIGLSERKRFGKGSDAAADRRMSPSALKADIRQDKSALKEKTKK